MNFSNLINLENVYLDSISEPNDNHLCLTFNRSKTNTVPESIDIGGNVINNVYSIDIDYRLPIIQIDFESYIGYSILNESYTGQDDYEIFEGKWFRIYSKSRYLDFIKSGTIATKDYPGPFKHYGIICFNHIIDIVSVSEPIIKEIVRTEI
ncbi:hypothetical protein SH2C18_03830 [Clostridium sediminicola]|uniref:hypothetical protein n=1 Tax=Clostridium sediminicola TaxID=3114879 RepID=UPI0031F1DD6F